MRDADLPLYFRLFNEVGIIEQLSRAMFEARLPDGVLLSQFSVLNHLMRVQDGRTPLELARAFQMPKTTMTHVLGVIEKRAWIEMRPNPEDKRSKQVWTTEAGRAFRDQAIHDLVPAMQGLEAPIPLEMATRMVADLEALRVWLDQNRA